MMAANSERHSEFLLRRVSNVCKQLPSLLVSRVSCLSPWARQNFPAALKIEKKLCLIGKKILKHLVFMLIFSGTDFPPTPISDPVFQYEVSLHI